MAFLAQSHADDNVYTENVDVWDDDDGMRKMYTDIQNAKKNIKDLGKLYEEDEEIVETGGLHNFGEDAEDELSVHTIASRVSIDLTGQNAFDQALRVKLNRKYNMAIRKVVCDKIRSWVNAVEVTAAYCPIQRQYYENPHARLPTQELRMRAVGVAAGSGFTVAVFDLEMGTILRTIEDPKRSAILCMSMSAPLARQKLAPLLATGHFDGRLVLRDMQTGTQMLNTISTIKHPGPVRQCLIMEGHKRPLAVAASDDKDGKAALYVYNFERGELACPVIQDHVEQITALTSISIPGMHSLFISASMDGYVHLYDMQTCERQLSLSPEMNTRGPVFALDVLAGSLTGNRPTLLLVGGMDGVIRIFNLGMGPLKAHSSSHSPEPSASLSKSRKNTSGNRDGYSIPIGGRTSAINGCYNIDSIQMTHKDANSKRPQQTYATALRGHKGKIFAVAGIATITLGCVSGGEDANIRIWNVETGQSLISINGLHIEEIRSIRVTLYPRPIIVSSGYDTRIVVLDLSVSTNGEHRRVMKALQTRQLFMSKPNIATPTADGGGHGRRTLIVGNMESAVGMLDKRTSIIGASRRGFGMQSKILLPGVTVGPAAPLPQSLPSIGSSPMKSSVELPSLSEQEAGDREEKQQKEKHLPSISVSKSSHNNNSTTVADANEDAAVTDDVTKTDTATGARIRRPSRRQSKLEKRTEKEKRFTVISLSGGAGVGAPLSRRQIGDSLEEGDEDEDEDSDSSGTQDSHPDGYDSDYVSNASEK